MVDFKKKLAEQRLNKLKDHLAKIKKDSAPNMNTREWTSRKKKEEELPPPSLEELDIPATDKRTLSSMIERLVIITKTQGNLKKEKENIVGYIKPLCKFYSLDTFQSGTNRASYYKMTKSTISKELLLAHNVSPEVIAECTITTDSWAFRASEVKEDEEEESS